MACLLGQSASGKVRCIDLPSLKGVCTALSSICWVPSGLDASGDRFQSLMAQCIIMAFGCSAWMSTCQSQACSAESSQAGHRSRQCRPASGTGMAHTFRTLKKLATTTYTQEMQAQEIQGACAWLQSSFLYMQDTAAAPLGKP